MYARPTEGGCLGEADALIAVLWPAGAAEVKVRLARGHDEGCGVGHHGIPLVDAAWAQDGVARLVPRARELVGPRHCDESFEML